LIELKHLSNYGSLTFDTFIFCLQLLTFNTLLAREFSNLDWEHNFHALVHPQANERLIS